MQGGGASKGGQGALQSHPCPRPFPGRAGVRPDCTPPPPHTVPGGQAVPVPALTFLWLFMSRPFSLRSFTNVLAR